MRVSAQLLPAVRVYTSGSALSVVRQGLLRQVLLYERELRIHFTNTNSRPSTLLSLGVLYVCKSACDTYMALCSAVCCDGLDGFGRVLCRVQL